MTDITGQMIIGSTRLYGAGKAFYAINPATDEALEPAFGAALTDDVERACALASAAFDTYRNLSPETRASFLECIAEEIDTLGDALIERAHQETALPNARLNGERGRTTGQLRLFAAVLRQGDWADVRIEPALPDRKPLPRPDMRTRTVPLGPVVVFGASNFPLAFSVAGGDTASALAAGAPVVCKAHPAHPGTSELVGQAIQKAVQRCNLPQGVFSLLLDDGHQVGAQLVQDSRIKAVGFTGSRVGGLALMDLAAQRPEPIPVYAEMSSINPVFLLPNALGNRNADIALGFVASLTQGAGQFCTNPGLLIALDGKDLESFMANATSELASAPAQTMLTPGIHQAYVRHVASLDLQAGTTRMATGLSPEGPNQCQAQLYQTTAAEFMNTPALAEEVFGPCALVVRCQSEQEMTQVANQLEGQLTATMSSPDNSSVDWSCESDESSAMGFRPE